jgi:hypothetical protein
VTPHRQPDRFPCGITVTEDGLVAYLEVRDGAVRGPAPNRDEWEGSSSSSSRRLRVNDDGTEVRDREQEL